MRVGLIVVGVVLLLIGSGPTVVGITTLGITGGHLLSQTNTNVTASFDNVVSIFGYAELGVGLILALLGAYLLIVGLRSPDKSKTNKVRKKRK